MKSIGLVHNKQVVFFGRVIIKDSSNYYFETVSKKYYWVCSSAGLTAFSNRCVYQHW